NMTGGTATINAIQVGLGGGGNTTVGTMNVSGGSLTISRGVGGASLAVGSGGVGNFTLSGNAIFQSRNVVTVGMSGTGSGTFNVIGSSVGGGPTAGTIGIGTAGTTDGIWNQGANGTLNMTIDASGVSTLFIDDKAQGDVAANFALGSLLGLDFNVAPYDGSFTLMEVENGDVTDSGLALTGSTDPNWSFAVDNSGANGLLIGTYLSVPEPGSISLLFASLGTLLVRRRR
ncbi:PEP-CTERM sorting domain-containing protein, partial [Akkermansiaceae bacterium]|nr:PEP-CTERM sorting domain-containing protein [Akkermansiaceae bacterium]